VLILAALLFGIFALVGCGGGGGGGGNPTGEVTGFVLDSLASDQGVVGATVTIGGASATTVTGGAFDVKGAKLGTDTAVVTVPGVTPQTIAFQPAVAPGTTQDIVLTINIGQIRGKVQVVATNGQTQPAANATVVDQGTGISTLTASDGSFLLDPIPTGSASVLFVAGPASATQTIAVGNGLNDIGTVTLHDPGVTPPPGIPNPSVKGTVTLADTSGVAPNTAVILFRNGVQFDSITTDVNGKYGFYAPAGANYTIQVVRPTYQTSNSAAFSVTDPSVPVTIDVTLQPNP